MDNLEVVYAETFLACCVGSQWKFPLKLESSFNFNYPIKIDRKRLDFESKSRGVIDITPEKLGVLRWVALRPFYKHI